MCHARHAPSSRHVRFTPNSGHWAAHPKSAFGCRFMSTRPSPLLRVKRGCLLTLMIVSNGCHAYRIKPERDKFRATPKSRVGRPTVWSAESALLLMVQGINLEPLYRILARTGGRDLPHRRWLHLRSCRPSMTRRSVLGRLAAMSAYGT